jgi:predicted PurR-regulated permease PerM
MNPKWRITTKYIVGICITIVFFVILYLSRSVIYLLIIGALIAFLIKPIIDFFHHRLHIPKGLAVFIAHLLAAILILLAPLILVPTIVNSVNFLLDLNYQALINNGIEWFETTLNNLKASGLQILGYRFVLDSIIDPILNSLHNVDPVITPDLPSYNLILDSITSAFAVSYGIAVSVVGTVFSIVVALFFIFISSIYLSADGDRLYHAVMNIVPKLYRPEIDALLSRLNNVWRSFLRGQFSLMLLIGIVVWIGGTIIGLPGAFALGVISGSLEIVPNLGPTLATIPAILVALIQGSTVLPVSNVTFVVIVIIFYILVQGLENYLIVPRVLGEAVKLHPMVVIFGVFVGASVGGIFGALLAAPVIASGKEIISYLLHKIMDEEPFPPEEGTNVNHKPPLELLKQIKMRIEAIKPKKNISPSQKQSDLSTKSDQ